MATEQTTPCVIVGTMSTSTRDNEPVTITGRIVTNPAPPAPAQPVAEEPTPAPAPHKK